MGQQGIEVPRVATVEKLLIGADFQSQAFLQDRDEFHAGVLMKTKFSRGHGAEVRQIRVAFTIGSGKVQGFKFERDGLQVGTFWETPAILLARHRESMFIFLGRDNDRGPH